MLSKAQYGTIHVQPDKPFYYAGEDVEGKLYLNLLVPFPADSIKLKIKAWESVKWIEKQYVFENPQQPLNIPENQIKHIEDVDVTSDSSDSDDDLIPNRPTYIRNKQGQLYKIIRHEGDRKIFKDSIDLQKFNGSVNAGQYVFPFKLNLNKEWPGTYSLKMDKERARIKYELRGFLKGKGKEMLKHKQELIVAEKTEIKSDIKATEANIVAWCCINKGMVGFKCFFQKNAYAVGEKAELFCDIDNTKCKVAVTHVTASLINHLTFIDDSNQRLNRNITVFTKQFRGCAIGEKIQFKEEVIMGEGKSFNDQGAKSKKNHRQVSPSATGKRIISEYSLSVRCEVDASCTCCGGDPGVTNAILIYPPERKVDIFEIPQNWQPQVANLVVVGGVHVGGH